MNYNYLTFNTSSDGMYFGSYFGENLQNTYNQQFVDDDNYFGTSIDDIAEVSIYNSNEDKIYFGILTSSVVYSIISGEYKDLDNNTRVYYYPKPLTDYVKFNSSLLLNTENILLQSNVVEEGNYNILYNFIRNISGNYDHNLIISDVSLDRTEIRFEFGFNTGSNVENYTYSEKIKAFAQKNIIISDIYDKLKSEINNNPIFDAFNVNSGNYNYYNICQLLGLKDPAQLQKYIYLLYYGNTPSYDSYNIINTSDLNITVETCIYDQINYYLLENNLIGFNKEDLLNNILNIITKYCTIEINKRTTLTTDNFDFVLNAFIEIIYNYHIKSTLENIIDEYVDRYFGYYKNALNFGNGELYKILNHTFYYNESEGGYNLQVKLDTPLTTQYDVNTPCWVSNISISPVYFSVNLYTEPESRKVKLSGVNFNVNVDKTYPTNELYENDLVIANNPVDLIYKLKENLNLLSIDYNDFNEFIIYSSAELRSKIAKNKILQYKNIIDKENSIKSIIENNKTNIHLSSSYENSYKQLVKDEYDILSTFDEYDAYLLFYSDVTSVEFEDKIQEAIEYDKQNPNSLVNQLPEYINSDKNYDDYIKFTAMIGHLFDIIACYIKKFPKLNSVFDFNFPKDYLDEFLKTHNWDTFNTKFQNSNMYKYLFEFDDNVSFYSYGKELLRRFSQNLPYIYKTTGTTKSLELIRSIYGVPSELIQIKEYGNANYPLSGETFYDFYSITYLAKYSNGKEYIQFDNNVDEYQYVLNSTKTVDEPCSYTSSNGSKMEFTSSVIKTYTEQYCGVKTVELSFRFDNSRVYKDNIYIPIIKKGQIDAEGFNIDWEIKAYKSVKSDFGKLYFIVNLPNGEQKVLQSKELPLFNGNIFTIFINKERLYASSRPDLGYDNITNESIEYNVKSIYNSTLSKYSTEIIYLTINQYDGYVNNFNYKGSIVIDNSPDIFEFSKGTYFVGNYLYSTEEPFYGNIDKIKVYTYSLSDADMREHSYNIDSISIEDKENLYKDLIYLWSFDTPINLYSNDDENLTIVNNCNDYYKDNKFYVYNFSQQSKPGLCEPEYYNAFPYQFDQLQLKQALNANTYGPNYKNNVKISKLDEYVSKGSVFTPYNYSTTTQTEIGEDSNTIGFYIDPSLYLENSIENYLGKEGISDILGDPINLKLDSYPKLKDRLYNFKQPNKKYIYPEEYYTIYKLYVDFSLFKYIDKVVPARSSLKRGLLIESNQLERTKINIDKIYNANECALEGSIKNYNYDNTSSQKYNQTTKAFLNLNQSPNIGIVDIIKSDIQVKDQTSFETDYYQYNYNLNVVPDKVDDRDYITPLNYIYYNNNISYYLISLNDIYTFTSVSDNKVVKNTKPYNKISSLLSTGSNSGFNYYNDNKYKGTYSPRHLSKFTRVGTRNCYEAVKDNNRPYYYRKGQNTSEYTINREGIPNGSLPIISIPGFLSLREESDKLDISAYVTQSSAGENYVIYENLTASMENSSSLEEIIYNL